MINSGRVMLTVVTSAMGRVVIRYQAPTPVTSFGDRKRGAVPRRSVRYHAVMIRLVPTIAAHGMARGIGIILGVNVTKMTTLSTGRTPVTTT